MTPKQAWIAFSLLTVLVVTAVMVALAGFGYPEMVVVPSGFIFLLLYFYVLYKRYNVEVVPESDIALFTDPDDLRILCAIYGLETTGDENDLRPRLVAFSRANSSRTFAWVAPKLVRSLGAALELSEGEPTTSSPVEVGPLTGGRARSDSRLTAIELCPVCDAKRPSSDTVCAECGADLEFYAVLRESKVGKRLVSEKARDVRRKLRYDVPALGGKR